MSTQETLEQENQRLKAALDKLELENQELRRRLHEEQRSSVGASWKSTVSPTSSEAAALVTADNSADAKVDLFLSLFKGRPDVYAKRFQSKKGHAGYSPVCNNEWQPNICRKPSVKCSACSYQDFPSLNQTAARRHLQGREVLGVYPLLLDGTCHFLAMDFDGDGWQQNVSAVCEVCKEHHIPCYIERSRSGLGGHLWFFFEQVVSARRARQFGTALLTHAMMKRHRLSFTSYDRLFPNQDITPKGGFGNLIALPLQWEARQKGCSVFVDDFFRPYDDQWLLLSNVKRLSPDSVIQWINSLSVAETLDLCKDNDQIEERPWDIKQPQSRFQSGDFPTAVRVTRANMLFIDTDGFSEPALNYVKRMAVFGNPKFYKLQAMRMPIKHIPRFIDLSEETERHLVLPRGCEDQLVSWLDENSISIRWEEERASGASTDVTFSGQLRPEQMTAALDLAKHDTGVLHAATAFGKTVVAAHLIGSKKVSTLILVHNKPLLEHWRQQLDEFLDLSVAELQCTEARTRGRKRKPPPKIGQIGGGKTSRNGRVDVATLQSLLSKDEIKPFVQEYGLIIVDECHHIPAFSFEKILRNVRAKYVYGLTATPRRQDGHDPIIHMQCGPIRHVVDAGKQATSHAFDHFIVPRFTAFRMPIHGQDSDPPIAAVYTQLGKDDPRNHLIVEDVVRCAKIGRSCLVLTQRTEHVRVLAAALESKVDNVVPLTGSMSKRQKDAAFERIRVADATRSLVIVSTGKFVGEGFDLARLDTLFLAMPVAWQGILQQYAGRLHRTHPSKTDVQIFDYIDRRVAVLDRMYYKRLKGYAAMGYRVKASTPLPETNEALFSREDLEGPFHNDIKNAQREVIIASPKLDHTATMSVLEVLKEVTLRGVSVNLVIRRVEDYPASERQKIRQFMDASRVQGLNILPKAKLHQTFAVIDQRIIWYGNVNLLSHGTPEENMMRLADPKIASELLDDVMDDRRPKQQRLPLS